MMGAGGGGAYKGVPFRLKPLKKSFKSTFSLISWAKTKVLVKKCERLPLHPSNP